MVVSNSNVERIHILSDNQLTLGNTMKLLILTVLSSLLLTGCASPEEVLFNRLQSSDEISAAYCDMSGFSKFYESNNYYSFQCKDGSKFRIPK